MVQQTENSEHKLPWSWLKSFSSELFTLDSAPLLGKQSPFPWDAFSKELATILGLGDLFIHGQEIMWREPKDLFLGISEPHFTSQISASGIDGTIAVVMSKRDVEWLFSHVMKLAISEIENAPDEIIDSFHRFIEVEALNIYNSLDLDKKVLFKLATKQANPQKACLCLDVWITIQGTRTLARLIMSNEFRLGWKNLNPKKEVKTSASPLLYNIEVPLSIEAGRTWVPMHELLKAQEGDFLIVDHTFYDPDDEKSKFLITYQDNPLFPCKLKQGSVKLLEIPLHHEVYDSMVDKLRMDDQDSSQSNHDEDDPFSEEHDDDSSEYTTEESEIFDETEIDDDEDDDDIELVDQETLHDTAHDEAHQQAAPVEPKKESKPQETPKFSEPLTMDSIPVCVVVEVARLSMPVQQVLDLQPGNLLDLNVHPENGVNLVINGKIIGRGELIKVGDTLGVRILEIGS